MHCVIFVVKEKLFLPGKKSSNQIKINLFLFLLCSCFEIDSNHHQNYRDKLNKRKKKTNKLTKIQIQLIFDLHPIFISFNSSIAEIFAQTHNNVYQTLSHSQIQLRKKNKKRNEKWNHYWQSKIENRNDKYHWSMNRQTYLINKQKMNESKKETEMKIAIMTENVSEQLCLHPLVKFFFLTKRRMNQVEKLLNKIFR